MRIATTLFACLLFPLLAHAQDHAQPVRVACVGDSITFGASVPERERWCYPAFLQALLGDTHDVRNFGRNGATLLHAGDIPYTETAEYRAALAFQPDIVVIALGTNDTKAHNWAHAEDFANDYASLIASFRDLPSSPRILVCLPVPAWTTGDSIDGTRLAAEVLPRVRQIAADHACQLIDLHAPLAPHRAWFPDDIHPNSFGTERVAQLVSRAIAAPTDPAFDITAALPDDAQPFDFHGYPGHRFTHDGVTAMVVQPHVAAVGRPWVWRARFWGHEPQTDRAMLERGWHIVYCDVTNLFGNPQAVARWDTFYARMRDAGLGDDLVLEGMSRGGLIIYNWAKANPNRVAAIYGDAPVCDIRSWPQGRGEGNGHAPTWAQCLDAWGITQAQSGAFDRNPIDGLQPLADASVPLLHIVGDADAVVPVAENSDVLEQRYRDLGGAITVIHKPGVGHHPHSLEDPTPIVDFFLAATDRSAPNFAAIPSPSAEHRGGPAGWGGGTWWDQFDAINQLADIHDLDVVFLGDSITQSFTGTRDRLARVDGTRAFDRFADRHAAAFGIAGDRTEHLLYRIAQGHFDTLQPKLIVVMIGVNNLTVAHHTGQQVADATAAIVDALAQHTPESRVLLLGAFPAGATPDDPRRAAIDTIHARAAALASADDDTPGDRVHYLDLRPLFLNDDGTLNANMRGDAIHLTPAGYHAWADAIDPVLRALLPEPARP